MGTLRLHRVAYSTNVERVALACGVKGVPVQWVDHADDDRYGVEVLSGQALVPVAEFGAEVVVDSTRIIERLDRDHPDPPLYPREPASRAAVETFIEWFNRVWKVPPNALAEDPHRPDSEQHRAQLRALTERFEAWLELRSFLWGAMLSAADVCAYPFLRYAVDQPAIDDPDPFHAVLHRELSREARPALEAWIGRIAHLPQA